MPLTAEQKKGLSADVLQEIENDEKENARLNRENGEKRTRANEIEREKKATETSLNELRDKMKKIGFDTGEDIEDQFPGLIEKVTKERGFKPSSEVDALTKKFDAMTKKLEAAEAQAARDKQEAMIEKVGGLFGPALQENFGKAAPLIQNQLRLTGKLAMKDGVAGIQNGDAFIPLNAENGSESAIDLLKKEYGDFVVTKQKTGTNGGGTNNTGGKNEKVMSRNEFEALAPLARMDFMKNGGQLAENIDG